MLGHPGQCKGVHYEISVFDSKNPHGLLWNEGIPLDDRESVKDKAKLASVDFPSAEANSSVIKTTTDQYNTDLTHKTNPSDQSL